MNKKFLVTTSLEETIPTDVPILLLGEWCRPFSQKKLWENLNTTILPYHWDNRTKLYNDYLYLDKFYENILNDLAFHLNKIHGTNHSVRYWRILAGPWLGQFIHIIFDRWSSIKSALESYELLGTHILQIDEETIIPKDMRYFAKLIVTEEWNHFIYSYIVQNHTSLNFEFKNIKKIYPNIYFNLNLNRTYKLKKVILENLTKLSNRFMKENDALLINTYLPRISEIKLSLKLKQFPTFHSYTHSLKEIKLEKIKRNWNLEGKSQNEFENFVRSIIPRQIPKVYLEGYKNLCSHVSSLPWPSKPKLIFTSNSYQADEIFKFYAAQKTEEGTPLVIGQHGGNIGTNLFAFYEKHQIDISDTYLSWGWTDLSKPKIKSVGQLKIKKPLNVNHSTKRGIILLVWKSPSQSFQISSVPIAGQLINYFDDQCRFIKNLNHEIQNELIVRHKVLEKGWEPSYSRWKEKFPNLKYDKGISNLYDLLKNIKIYVSTYNATTFLESFSMNIPTVMFWNPNHWEIRPSAKIYFNNLKEVGILHESPETASKHVNLIWNDVNSWWNRKEVKEAVNTFKKNFCYSPNNLITRIHEEFQDTIEKHKKI